MRVPDYRDKKVVSVFAFSLHRFIRQTHNHTHRVLPPALIEAMVGGSNARRDLHCRSLSGLYSALALCLRPPALCPRVEILFHVEMRVLSLNGTLELFFMGTVHVHAFRIRLGTSRQ
jgi:hypothetical protein